MSDIPLRLVHSRPFTGQTDDLAITLLFSIAGLTLQLIAAAAAGFAIPLA